MFKKALMVVAIGFALGCGGDATSESKIGELLREAEALDSGKEDAVGRYRDRTKAELCSDFKECLDSYNTGNNSCAMSAADARRVSDWRALNCDDLPYCSTRAACWG